ncbi:MAG: FAD-binding oxidoreductase [Planctomycetota bacterium]
MNPARTRELEARLVEKGYVFSCRARPRGDLAVALGDAVRRVPARVVGRELLSETVLSLRVEPEAAFPFEPGQYATLHRSDGLARPYSIASQPEDGPLEFQIRLVPGGAMTPWLFESAGVGEVVEVSGPAGECVYRSPDLDEPLLLVGFGTGLAPMWGILGRARSRGPSRRDPDRAGRPATRSPLSPRGAPPSRGGDARTCVTSRASSRATPLGSSPASSPPRSPLLPSAKGWRAPPREALDLVAAAQRRLFSPGASPPSPIHVEPCFASVAGG